jgi:glycosyltransferase involved in cell wall biosynthesis
MGEIETAAIGVTAGLLNLPGARQTPGKQVVLNRRQTAIIEALAGTVRCYDEPLIRSLSVVIPAFNEESRLPDTLRQVTSYVDHMGIDFAEVMVVDDGSTDRTLALAQQFAASHPKVRALQNPGNRGKGYAVRHGMLAAKGDWRLFTDADLSTPIEELAKLACAAERTGADVAIGSRAIDRSLIKVHQPAFREFAGKCFNVAMRATVGLPLRDTQCGFKLFSQRAADALFPRQLLDRFGFDVEVLLIAQMHGFQINEVPVEWSHAEGTKVSTLTGAKSFLELLVIRRNQLAGRYS